MKLPSRQRGFSTFKGTTLWCLFLSARMRSALEGSRGVGPDLVCLAGAGRLFPGVFPVYDARRVTTEVNLISIDFQQLTAFPASTALGLRMCEGDRAKADILVLNSLCILWWCVFSNSDVSALPGAMVNVEGNQENQTTKISCCGRMA